MNTDTSSSSASFVVTPGTATGQYVPAPAQIDQGAVAQAAADRQAREDAVFTHIQAIRAMGRITINTVDIGLALGMSTNEVESTLVALRSRGVRIA